MQISAFIPHAFLAAVPAAILAGGSPWLIVPAIPLVFVALDAAYTRLRHDAAAPTLPHGFGIIMCLALVPPLWRRVMDPRADYWMARLESDRL